MATIYEAFYLAQTMVEEGISNLTIDEEMGMASFEPITIEELKEDQIDMGLTYSEYEFLSRYAHADVCA